MLSLVLLKLSLNLRISWYFNDKHEEHANSNTNTITMNGWSSCNHLVKSRKICPETKVYYIAWWYIQCWQLISLKENQVQSHNDNDSYWNIKSAKNFPNLSNMEIWKIHPRIIYILEFGNNEFNWRI